jgi:succinyl-diaminopimelate desuccinylase
VTKIAGGIASNVIPGEAEALVNFRYAPGRSPEEAETRLAELCRGGTLEILSNSPSGPVATANPHARRLAALGNLEVAPKQAWTPVAEFGLFGLEAINFGPGAPAQANQVGEYVDAAALVRCYELLESFA